MISNGWNITAVILLIMASVLLIAIILQAHGRSRSIDRIRSKKRNPEKNNPGGKRKVVVLEGFSGRSIENVAGSLFKMLGEMGLEIIPIEHMPYKGIIPRLIHAKSIEEFAEQAYSKIAKLNDNDVIIAYSMGVLVLRYVLEKMGIGNNPTVILVGGPNLGCRWKYAFLFLVPCIREMLPGSEFLKEMGLPSNRDYWYLVADQDEKVSPESACPVLTDRDSYFDCGHRMFDYPSCLEQIKKIITMSGR
ncbi:MAG: hypothetical protein WC998_03040 [Candidatus Paceibacterota bacterium]